MIEVSLVGDAHSRGLQQADCPPRVRGLVRRWIGLRRARAASVLRTRAGRRMATALWDHLGRHHADALAEIEGMAEGFGLVAEDLFLAMHAVALRESAARPWAEDGCTTVGLRLRSGTVLGKNRDVPGDVLPLQRVFRQHDPNWRCGPILGISSLGSAPCASSGINRAGLALADTQVATRDHGLGVSRYILMQELLAHCADVDQALMRIRRTAHLGGGTLVLADAGGTLATVELGHGRQAIERRRAGIVVRTNHHLSPGLRGANAEPASSAAGRNSRGRLDVARRLAATLTPDSTRSDIAALFARHGPPEPDLCRHRKPSPAETISLALFAPQDRGLWFWNGRPCGVSPTWHGLD